MSIFEGPYTPLHAEQRFVATMVVSKVACKLNHRDMVNLLLDFNAPRDEKCFGLLNGETRDAIYTRWEAEKQEAIRREQAKRALQGTVYVLGM